MDLINRLRWQKHLQRNASNKRDFLCAGVEFTSKHELKAALCKNAENKEVCHVIGSGASLWETKDSIRSGDFVVGFLFTGLVPDLDHDVIFFEHGGDECKSLSKLSLQISDMLDQGVVQVFKNWEMSHNDVHFVRSNWCKRAYILHDMAVMNYNRSYSDYLVRKALDEKPNVYIQIQNTTFAGILLGFYLGFKKIVLHGVDLGGPYFYNYLPDRLRRLTPGNSPKNLQKSVSLMDRYVPILGMLSLHLASYGVHLFSSSPASGSSHVLDPFH